MKVPIHERTCMVRVNNETRTTLKELAKTRGKGESLATLVAILTEAYIEQTKPKTMKAMPEVIHTLSN